MKDEANPRALATPLEGDFDWTFWRATEEDTAALDPRLAARLLFDVLLIQDFEHAVLDLKNQGLPLGPGPHQRGAGGRGRGERRRLPDHGQVDGYPSRPSPVPGQGDAPCPSRGVERGRGQPAR